MSEPFDFAGIKELHLHDLVVKETLRLRPPIIVIMRKVLQPIEYKNYVIPAGHYVAASPALSQLDPDVFPKPNEFRPERFDEDTTIHKQEEWDYHATKDIGTGTKSHYLPFGAGKK